MHLESSIRTLPVHCNLCGVSFADVSIRAAHVDASPAHPSCGLCHRRFLNDSSLFLHLNCADTHSGATDCNETLDADQILLESLVGIEIDLDNLVRYQVDRILGDDEDSGYDSEDYWAPPDFDSESSSESDRDGTESESSIPDFSDSEFDKHHQCESCASDFPVPATANGNSFLGIAGLESKSGPPGVWELHPWESDGGPLVARRFPGARVDMSGICICPEESVGCHDSVQRGDAGLIPPDMPSCFSIHKIKSY